ncbi:hypothetical protein M9Y10_038259 [Tritrichomonas musculus]|uniref:Protein kinase domain-containing protein n=1 Tax=Tritrichomonas musculus TaxID=1915356 RepID=A0ABR2K8M0_9EUKA
MLSDFLCNVDNEYEQESKAFADGSYGNIYKGKRIKDDLQVAIKVLKSKKLSEDIEEQKHFIREVNILANLNHPFCLRLVNFSFLPEPKIVTPFMPNGTLDDLLKSNDPTKFTPTEKMCSIYALCSTMDLLHQAGIIHRDLKPANIFITDDKDICIADFGSARKVQKNVDLTVSPLVTPLHAAPEAIFGEEYTNMIDVYSFGVIYYQYFNHSPNFPKGVKAKTAYDFVDKIRNGTRFIRPPEMNDFQWSIYENCTQTNESIRPKFHDLEEIFEKNESSWFTNVDREKYMKYISRCKEIKKECIKNNDLYLNLQNDIPSGPISNTYCVIPPPRKKQQSIKRTISSPIRFSHKHYDDDDDESGDDT